MKKTLLCLLLFPAALVMAQTEKPKKFAIHYQNMIGTEAEEVRFSQHGQEDEWAPGSIYYPNKDLSKISYITRYFPVKDFSLSQADVVMRPGEKKVVEITFSPEESVVHYVDRLVYSSNDNVAKAVRINGAQIEISAVSAGKCTLRVMHSEAGTKYIQVEVQPDEEYVYRTVDSLLALMTTEEKLRYVGGTNWYYTQSIDRLDIPSMRMCDGPQGVGLGKSTAYPSNQALAATWNRELAQQYGQALGRDCRARGINIILGPGVNIYRAPLCGRNFEYMGEDPYLAGQTAANYIKGVESQGVSTTVKHFLANNSDYDRDHISNDMDERTMNEIYLPAFKAAVQEGGTACVMTSYNLINGIYTTHSHELLTTILRDRWGFEGLVMSDWGSTHDGLAAAKAGLDLEMASGDQMSPEHLSEYIRNGDLTMEDIDKKVRHILYVLVSRGFKDGMQQDNTLPLDNPENDSVALNVAREQMVLLKNNNGILPVDTAKYKRIVVTGKNATDYISGGGSGNVAPHHYVSFYEGIRQIGEQMGVEVECKDKLDFQPAIMYTDNTLEEAGLKAEYFSNPDLNGTPIFTRTETKMSYIWSGKGPDVEGLGRENFSVRWSGVMNATLSANYVFTIGGDDAYRLIIDGDTVVNAWTPSAYHSSTYTKRLVRGQTYSIVVEYYQKGGDARMDFTWKRSGDIRDYLASYLADADLVVACFGMNSSIEGEGHDRSFNLPSEDIELLNSIRKSGKPAIAIINGGGAVEMKSWENTADGILWAFYAGQEGGTAVGEILFGLTNPSGHLPFTFERAWEENPVFNSYHDPDGDKHVQYTEGIFVGYRGYDKLGREVQYPFGYGLSYTTFSLTDMEVSPQREDGSVEVSCLLTNTGQRAGAQVVQAYLGRKNGEVERPIRELKNYTKVHLEAGESQRVKWILPKSDFTYYSTDVHDFVYDPGLYNVMLGFSSRDIQCQETIEMK